MNASAPGIVRVKVEPTMKRELDGLAREHERTLSGEVRLALRRHIERENETTIAEGVAAGAAAA